MAQDVEVSDDEIARAVEHLVKTKTLKPGDSLDEATDAIAGFLAEAKKPTSVLEDVGHYAGQVTGGIARGLSQLGAGMGSLESAWQQLTAPLQGSIVGAVGKAGGLTDAQTQADVSQARAMSPMGPDTYAQGSKDLLSGVAENVFPPQPRDIIQAPGVGKYLSQEAPEVAGQTLGILATGGAAGPLAAGALAGGSFGGQSWQSAKAQGATDQQAAAQAAVGLGAGILQATLLGRIFLRSPKLLPMLANTGTMAGANLATEAVQDEIAKHTYDDERAVLGRWKENLAGTIIGAGLAKALAPHAPQLGDRRTVKAQTASGSIEVTAREAPPGKPSAASEPVRPTEAPSVKPTENAQPAKPQEAKAAPKAEPAPEAPKKPVGEFDWDQPVPPETPVQVHAEPARVTTADEPVPVTVGGVPFTKSVAEMHPLLATSPEAISALLEQRSAEGLSRARAVLGGRGAGYAEAYADLVRRAEEPTNPESARAREQIKRLEESLSPAEREALRKKTPGEWSSATLRQALDIHDMLGEMKRRFGQKPSEKWILQRQGPDALREFQALRAAIETAAGEMNKGVARGPRKAKQTTPEAMLPLDQPAPVETPTPTAPTPASTTEAPPPVGREGAAPVTSGQNAVLDQWSALSRELSPYLEGEYSSVPQRHETRSVYSTMERINAFLYRGVLGAGGEAAPVPRGYGPEQLRGDLQTVKQLLDTWGTRKAEMESAPKAPEPHGAFLLGRDTAVVLDDARSIPGAYAAVEAESLVPSHDARKGYRKNEGGDVNERPYDDPTEGKALRANVEKIAGKPNPALLLTDTPTAIDGPPIVTEDGVVLGGNARTMAMQLAYSKGGAQAETIRGATREALAKFGIVGAEGIKNPVIVRMIQPGMEGAPGELSRSLNAALTTGRTPLSDAVSRGSKVTPEAAGAIAGIVGEGSLREALGDPTQSKKILRELVLTGAVSDADVVNMTDVRGLPTQAARDIVEQALLGAIVPDVRALAAAQQETKNALIRSLPSLIQIKTAWPEFATKLRVALDGMASLRSGKKALTVEQGLTQSSLIPEPWQTDPHALALMRAFESDSGKSLAARFQNIAEATMDVVNGQSLMFFNPAERTPQTVFELNMPDPVMKVQSPAAEAITPVEVRRPELFGNDAAKVVDMHGGPTIKMLAKALGFTESEVASAQPNPKTIPTQQEIPGIGSGEDLRRTVELWDGGKRKAQVFAKVEQQKYVEQLKAITGRRAFKQALKETFGVLPRQEAIAKLSGAMTHWVEHGGNTQAIAEKAALLTDPEFAPYAERALLGASLPDSVKAIAEKIRVEQNQESAAYQDRGLITSWIENYVTHLWRQGEGSTQVRGSSKFSLTSPRQLKRSFPTLLDGLIEMQRRKLAGEDYSLPLTDSALDLQRVKREQLANLIENRNLMISAEKSGLVSRYPDKDGGWQPITYPGFRRWMKVGQMREGSAQIAVSPEDAPFLPGVEHGQVIPEAQLKVWGPDILVTDDGSVLMRPLLYAEPSFGKALDRALRPSDLSQHPVFAEVAGVNNAVKTQVLAYDWSHHLTITGRLMLTTPSLKGLNPAHAYKMGQQALAEHHPDVGMLIRDGGLTLQNVPDWTALERDHRSRVGKIIEKLPVAKNMQAGLDEIRRWQEGWLFGQYIPSLKTYHALLELNALRRSKPNLTDSERARIVGEQVNNIYGGQNLIARNRSPVAQDLFRLVDLAPDWRESSIRLGTGGFKTGAAGQLYRTMWLRAASRAFGATVLWNLAMGAIDTKDRGSYLDHVREMWKQGRLPMFELDITPFLSAFGQEPSGRKYISMLWKMDEAYKLTSGRAFDFAAYRSSPIARFIMSTQTGEDTFGNRFTTTGELTGTADLGFYKEFHLDRRTGQVQIPGQAKNQKLSGHLIAPGQPNMGHMKPEQIASFLGQTAVEMAPAAAQNMGSMIFGQMNGMEAFIRALGVPVQTERKPR